jgi:hypothetical protein
MFRQSLALIGLTLSLSLSANAAIVSPADVYNDETIYFDAEGASWWDLYADNGWSVQDSWWSLDGTVFKTDTLQFSVTGQELFDDYGAGNHVVSLSIGWEKQGAGQQFPMDSETILIYGSNAPSPVPLPAAAWLFGSALIGLVGIKRKRA